MDVVKGPPQPQGMPPAPQPSNLNFQLVDLTGPDGRSFVGIMATVSTTGGAVYVFLTPDDSDNWASGFANAAAEARVKAPGLVVAEVVPDPKVLRDLNIRPHENGGRTS